MDFFKSITETILKILEKMKEKKNHYSQTL